jgi:hypothetical protein
MSHFDDYQFRQKVDRALNKVKTILHNARNPEYAADVPHSYDDKFGLAEFLTNAALAAESNVLEALGLTEKNLKKMVEWAKSRSVTLRLKATESWAFDREETRKVESSTEYVTEYSSSVFGSSKRTDKVVTKITEYFWKFDVDYELFAFKGNDPEEKISLQARKGKYEIITTSKVSPRPEVRVYPSRDYNLTWMLQNIEPDTLTFTFKIDRTDKSCRTPRRNAQIVNSLYHFSLFSTWAQEVSQYFRNELFPVQTNHGLDLGSLNADSLFVPIAPLFEDAKAAKPKTEDSSSRPGALVALKDRDVSVITAVLPISDLNNFLWEQKRSFSEKLADIGKVFPSARDGKLITAAEAAIVVLVAHAVQIQAAHSQYVDYIEEMLRRQFISAIGKEISSVDFTNYMRFHNRKLFKGAFEPQPFCYAIRRPDHYPEGTISIETDAGAPGEPVYSSVRVWKNAPHMKFPINAATRISFGGERYLHSIIQHQFAGSASERLKLISRARQFSSFILIVGRIASADVFEPKAAMIIQNKDDLTIPLEMEQIPTPKEFRDAIESLSPEQQRFCKAYRQMQLESTLFGLCIIQIKPQLEKLLYLPEDSLTKEIRLTQDLLELFIKYQIPSDLLSFDEKARPNASASERLTAVKNHVTAMQQMLNDSKNKELKEAAQSALYNAIAPPSPSPPVQLSAPRAPMRSMAMPVSRSSAMPSAAPMMMMSAPPPPPSAPSASYAPPPPPPSAPAGPPPPPAPAPAPAPAPSTSAAEPASTPEPEKTPSNEVQESSSEAGALDFTKIPGALDKKFEALDEDSALRPTIINIGKSWTFSSQKALLADPETETLNTDRQKKEKNRAFDLLDALSRSGAMTIDSAELHVVIAATHCFDQSIINTIVQDNVNPIEKCERSTLIVATTIHDKPAAELIKGDQVERVKTYSPKLFLEGSAVPAIKN